MGRPFHNCRGKHCRKNTGWTRNGVVAGNELRRTIENKAETAPAGIMDVTKDGNLSEPQLKAKQERLENWRTLQELAGMICSL